MPRFEPFPGIRFAIGAPALAGASLEDLVTPPYDVISPERRAELAARHSHNAVHIDLPEADGNRSPYEVAAELFGRWQREGALVRDTEPAFYTYRMDTTDDVGRPRRTIGVIGALELSRPDEGQVLPHEHTTPKAKSDRLELLRATRANLSPIWGLSPAAGLTDLLHDAEILGRWTGSDGTRHELGRITRPATIDAIRAKVASVPMVIADGHHRYETSLAYRDECRARGGVVGDAGGAELTMTFVVELVESELTVLPIHRLLSGLPVGFDLTAALSPWFDVRPVDGPIDARIMDRMAAAGALCLVLPESAALLVPRPDALGSVRDLDSSRLDVALAELPEHEVTFQHGVEHVVQRVRQQKAQAGVLLRPVRVEQIAEIANGGDRMPPKSTYFHPKPSTGAVFRSLDV
ncbi:MAG TPA: DUF1015 domain-containing protein [Acidimicrobiales bacterium]